MTADQGATADRYTPVGQSTASDQSTPIDHGLLADLAKRYGTPLYVYDLAAVRACAKRLRSALPEGTSLHYSLKANPHPLIVRELSRAGMRTEVSSAGEVEAVIRAGAPAAESLYTGPGKTTAELELAVRSGIRLFSVESVVDRNRLAQVAASAGADLRYLVRTNGSVAGGGGGLRMTGAPTQFGVPAEDEEQIADLFRPRGRTTPVGLHTFSASNLVDQDAMIAEFSGNLDVAAQITERTGVPLELLDLGGGFPAPFAVPGAAPSLDGLRERLTAVLDDRVPRWRDGHPAITFESGRGLVATCGVLLATVLDVKAVRGHTYVVLDAGVNTLGGMSGLGRLLAPSAQPVLVTPSADPAVTATIVGPLCTPLDVHSRRATVEGAIVGAVLAFQNTGAYGLTASLLAFLSRPAATEVVIDDGTVVGARFLTLTETEVPT